VSTRDTQAIQELKSTIAEGKNWYVAVLEGIRLWSSAEEDYNGRHYQYVIDDEAFDWLALLERLCEELDGLVPEKERVDLLFFGIPTQSALLKQFRTERHHTQLKSISFSELNEFTYWLFKYRIKNRDKSRMASDTKKALTKLNRLLKLKTKSLHSPLTENQ